MKLFNKKRLIRKIHIQYVYPWFKTIDGEYHTGETYAMDKNSLNCSCGEYCMINVQSMGYLEGKDGIQYPLTNIISIDWKIDKEADYNIEETFRNANEIYIPQIYYSNREIEAMENCKDKNTK